MTIDRVRVINAGSPGGAASTNFYFLSATTAGLTALGTFFTALKPYFPTTITMQIPSTGDQVNDATGVLVGSWAASGGTSITGSGTGIAATPVGLEVAWLASDVIDGHRPVGKTLIVPVSSQALTTSGVIGSAVITAVNSAAAALIAATTSFGIWHRPVYNRKVDPPQLVRPGVMVAISSGICRSAPTVLRSRRQ